MKELVIISGKGGTGKTSIVSAFASLAENKILCDADVDAADLHLITAPDIQQRNDFKGGCKAVIDEKFCTECGLCRDLCKWNAINDDFVVNDLECEGCGVCVYFCPEKAIEFPVQTCGEWYISETRFGPMVHARLGIAEENSGRLVTLVRQEAKKLAEKNSLDLIITDGPPGIGCPVIASIGGASAVLIVTEPTVSSRHDMERVAQLAAHFKVPAMVCVNKFDLNQEETQAIEKYSESMGMAVLGKIPFDNAVTKSMVQGKTVFEYDKDSISAQAIMTIWKQISKYLNDN
ncbi:MAG: P-loop NTPase [Proteobacteria bacterium]|nr:P-loop NTPase [Pseudomonadota bacterium]